MVGEDRMMDYLLLEQQRGETARPNQSTSKTYRCDCCNWCCCGECLAGNCCPLLVDGPTWPWLWPERPDPPELPADILLNASNVSGKLGGVAGVLQGVIICPNCVDGQDGIADSWKNMLNAVSNCQCAACRSWVACSRAHPAATTNWLIMICSRRPVSMLDASPGLFSGLCVEVDAGISVILILISDHNTEYCTQ